jgi:hypothetical protein
MPSAGEDRGLEAPFDLNGEVIVLESGLWVKFVVHRVASGERRVQGTSYSLSLHDPSVRRIFGIDNAHPVRLAGGPSGRRRTSADHVHRGGRVTSYDYRDAATLLADFWAGVASVVRAGDIDE